MPEGQRVNNFMGGELIFLEAIPRYKGLFMKLMLDMVRYDNKENLARPLERFMTGNE